jgi:16S rRNA (cytosine1402-N4)-methyltransferase
MEHEPVLHEPVLVKEVLEYLAPAPGKVIVDCNLGHGGHSLAILEKLGDKGLLVGIDRDIQMLEVARKRIEATRVDSSRSMVHLIQADHLHLPQVLAEVQADAPVTAPDGILFDLGPSTPQLLDPARGMSWLSDQALDMRMDAEGPGLTAAEIINTWKEEDLARLFFEHADERWSRRIARRIVEARERQEIRTGKELGEIVAHAIPRQAWPPKIHPATRVFLALRIEVNREYRTLEEVLPLAFELLKPGGRLVVITFHSGEDRRVKEFMRRMATPPEVPWPYPQGNQQAAAKLLTRKPVEASPEEQARNPRSRSAKLRAIEKV